MAKKIDPLQAKAARQKKIAIVGGVLLLGLLAFQVPRTMKMLNSGGNVTTSAATTASSTTTPGSTPLAPPSLDGGSSTSTTASGTGSSAAVSADGVQDPSAPLPASSGQLVSFNRFKSKDPFSQQITDCGTGGDGCTTAVSSAAAAGGGSASSAGSSSSGGGTGSSAGKASAPSGASAPVAASGRAPAPKVTTATISVNGKTEAVSVGKSFPADDPVFTMVALTRKEAKIGIAGGSFENGSAAVTLRLGKTLTLENTADGARYVLKLLRTS
jgi:hypothetical protein